MSIGNRTICALALTLVPTTVLGGGPTTSFTLGAYIPENVWLYVHEVHNPDRDFIGDHWDTVLEAAAQSGIDVEIKQLILDAMHDDDRKDFDAKWDKVRKALFDVPWTDRLGAREFAMGQRIALPMPTYMFLFRNKPGETKAITKSLVTLMKTIADVAHGCAIMQDDRHGAEVWSLCLGDVGPVCEMFSRGDIIGAAIGKGAMDEMLALVSKTSKKGSARSILDDPTFQRAMKSIEPPGDFVQFMRMTRFFEQIRGCVGTGFRKAKGHKNARTARDVVFKALNQFNVIDYSVWTRRTEGLQEFNTGVTKLARGTKRNPLVRAITQQRPIKQFDRFVPKDAAGFSVSTGIDFGLVYNTVIDFIRKEIPNGGADAIADWEAFQKEQGFNVKRDVFKWLSGEFVSVTLPGKPPMQAGGALMLRTRNRELAWEKVSSAVTWLGGRFPQVLVNPAPEVDAEGFLSVFHPMMMMMQVKPVIGMYEDWLVIGMTPQDVNKCLAVARGKTPSIRANARFQAEGLSPEGPISGVSFADWRKKGEELGTAFGMFGMVGGFMPPNEDLRPVRTMFTLLARLAPVVAKIDFYSSHAAACRFTGDGWEHSMVTTYKPADVAPLRDARPESQEPSKPPAPAR